MTIYHIDKAYIAENDRILYYVFPYNLRGTIYTHLKKWWIGNNGKDERDIIGLIRFLRLSSFNRKKLERKVKKMNND